MSLENTQAQVDDQALQFKKRARRRLVGAIALVLIMIAVLPMVLDDRSAKQPQQEIAISIPSQESTDFASKVVPVAPETTVPSTEPNAQQPSGSEQSQPLVKPPEQTQTQVQAPKPDLPPKANMLPNGKALKSPAPSAEPLPSTTSTVNAHETLKNAKTATEVAKTSNDKTASKDASPKPSPKVEAADKNKSPDKKAEKTATKNTDTKKSTEIADTSHKIVVQVGVFSDADKVKQMQQKLSQAGIKAYTEQLATDKGEKTRLRAGPYANRQDADAALEKVKSLGMPGMVITK